MNFISRILTTFAVAVAIALPAGAVTPSLKIEPKPEKAVDLAYIGTWKAPAHYEIPRLPVAEAEDDADMAFIVDLLEHARTFTGTRYRRGGKKPGGFDCSGFTSYVFRQFGLTLGASSRDQYRQGEQVAEGELRPGDLVFFSGRAGGKRTVGHVGIVTEVDADGAFRFIHSSCGSGVIESRSGEPYYSRRYIGARRMSF